MPLFEYRCEDCGGVSEFLEKAGTRGPHACKHCESKNTEKVFSTFAARGGSDQAPACRDACESPCCQTGRCPMQR
jgi:putative FmdB family regulatory protein